MAKDKKSENLVEKFEEFIHPEHDTPPADDPSTPDPQAGATPPLPPQPKDPLVVTIDRNVWQDHDITAKLAAFNGVGVTTS